LLRNVLNDLDSTSVEKIAHLLRDLIPGARRIIAENYAHNRKQDENQWREREDCIVRERGT
jgi:hypothetical protein